MPKTAGKPTVSFYLALARVMLAMLLSAPVTGALGQTESIPDFSGVWMTTSPRGGLGGPRPALTPQAQADLDAFDPLEDPVIRCVPPGFPRTGAGLYPWEIVQTDKLILFLYETFGMIRRIHLDGREPPSYLPPGLMGFSVGRWEGDDLVIRTTHYGPGLVTGSGIRQYGDMVVDERYRLVDGGRGLEGEVVVTAPATFEGPWSRNYTWEVDPDGMIFESICDPDDSRF